MKDNRLFVPVLAAVAAGVVALIVWAMVSGEDRKCLDYDTQTATTTTVVNGKPRVSTGLVTVCVRYEEAVK
ncbi:hypothetical protein [Streptomyces sp. NPDC058644]|uniref:hypothetical protein n=1 Tax=unclassified Streptomyces TaxID=2593676 RepID=UPI00366222F9